MEVIFKLPPTGTTALSPLSNESFKPSRRTRYRGQQVRCADTIVMKPTRRLVYIPYTTLQHLDHDLIHVRLYQSHTV